MARVPIVRALLVLGLVGCGGAVAVEAASGVVADGGGSPTTPPPSELDATPGIDATTDDGEADASDASTGCDVRIIPQEAGCDPRTTSIDPALCGLPPLDADGGRPAADAFCARLFEGDSFGIIALPQPDGTFYCSLCM